MSNQNLHKFKFKNLIDNNKFILAISLLIAIVFWCSTAINVSPEETKTLTEIPVTFDLSIPEQYNLLPFNDIEAVTAKVTVKGKKSKLGSITKDDVKANVDCSQVNKSGTYNIQIDLSIADDQKKNDFSIVADTTQYARVWFDTLSTGTMNLKTEITGKEKIAEGYIMGEPALSTDVVSYSGPTQMFNQVKSIVVRSEISENATDSITVDQPNVVALDANGDEVNNILFEYNNSKLSLVIPILKQATLPVSVNFINAPAGFTEANVGITYEPANLAIGASPSYLNSTSALPIGDIDFATLTPGVKTFRFDVSKLKDVTVTDSSIKEVVVTMDFSNYTTTSKLSVVQGNIQMTNMPKGYNVELVNPSIENVTVMGPAGVLSSVTSADLYAVVDLTNIPTDKNTYTQEIEAKVTLKNQSQCWVIKNYRAIVRITRIS